MINSMRQFFESRIKPSFKGEESQDAGRTLRLATAALLIEVTHADYEVIEEERIAVDEALINMFNLSVEDTKELVMLAEKEVKDSSCLYQFTNEVDKNLSYEQKTQIVEMLWRVAFSDSHKDKYEEHLIRKIADLLHISHKDFIQARHRVEAALSNYYN